ncbi:hypothetical protein CC1G_14088 [Coprinopsis cinerea okayama7|uniref:GPI inositol-deacylase winged helix domain-containing protein n=1 Tax=Coprinopsis cinerea (strain Okayama-7 / 130 / ATCC MYA-4618 / FGSC 9003) TaxID=240176 RepID=D6RLA6_COPC7|nr:hypothetical protein CC1G_14088 [Coprinopsis cinerea okayama7\|eukprot:XP_002911556.1 hypothetical protein CC1G_14088 [Coprinopsis cinerea okayama7\
MEALRDCLCLADVQEELDNFPADITEMYTLTFRRIEAQGPRSARIAKTALLWLVHARDQFTLRDLQAALAVNPNTYSVELNRMPRKQSIISLCCGLVEHHPETDVVRLVHFTAKDALEPLLLKDHPQPHLLITKVLHQRLIDNNILDSTLDDEDELLEYLEGQPLLQYAYQRWPDHVRGCRDSVEVAAAFLQQCVSFAYVDLWIFDILSPLHVAAAYDFPEFIQATLADPCNQQAGSCLGVPIAQGVDINAHSRFGRTALGFASNKGHVACAEALLGCPDIDVNAPVPLTGQTALMEASRMAQEGMVERLLRVPGVAVNAQDKSGETALMQALLRNSTGIVRRLLQAPGIDVNLRNTVGRTALIIAAGYGHLDVFEQLLQAPGIDLTIRCDFKGFTALEQAIWVGWEGVTARIIKFATGWEVKFGRRRRGWKELFYALRSEPERFPPWFVTAMSKRLAMFEGGEEWWRVEIEEESSDESDTE